MFSETLFPMATSLVKRTPFARDEIGLLRRHCKKSKWAETFAPDQTPSELRRRILEGASPRLTTPDGLTDLTATTDDRPFFFQPVAARALPRILGEWSTLRAERQGLFTALLLLAGGLLLGLSAWLATGNLRAAVILVAVGGASSLFCIEAGRSAKRHAETQRVDIDALITVLVGRLVEQPPLPGEARGLSGRRPSRRRRSS